MAAPRWSQTRLWDLFDLGPLFSSGPEQYLSVALARSVQWFQASGGSVFLGEPGDAVFYLAAKHGLQARMPDDACVKIGRGIAGVVAASGSARIIDDPKSEPDLAGQATDPIAPIKSAMVVPLVDHDLKVFGVVNIARTKGEQAFCNADLEQAGLLASQMALAVRNAQMVDAITRKAEETLRVNEKLTAVLDSVAGAVLVVDCDGSVVNQNSVAADLLYWAAQPPEELVPLRATIAGVIEQLHSQNRVFVERCHDTANARTWLCEAVPLGNGAGVVTVREVTEIEAREREMARVKRLAEIGQMTAAIAHEIRNPLTGIRSAAQTVRQHPELADELLGMIDDEVSKLNLLCEDFLEFARPMHVELRPARLAEVTEKVVNLVRPQFLGAGVVIDLKVERSEAIAQLDPRRVEQVLHNLLQNALHASMRGNVVHVTVSTTVLVVEDFGVGMDEGEQARLFSPFFTTKASGTGLGLCNVRKIVDAHGGTIDVDSLAGHGTRVTVEFSRKKS